MCEGTIDVARKGVLIGFFFGEVRSPCALHVSPYLQLPLAKLWQGAFDLIGFDDEKALICISLVGRYRSCEECEWHRAAADIASCLDWMQSGMQQRQAEDQHQAFHPDIHCSFYR